MIASGATPFSTQRSRAADTTHTWIRLLRGQCSNLAWPRTSGAMLHAGHHIEANEIGHALRAHFRDNALVIVDGPQRRKCCVVPPVVQNELAAATLEGAQVRIDGVEQRTDALIAETHITVDIEGPEAVRGVLMKQVGTGLGGERELQAAVWRRPGHPATPIRPARFHHPASNRGKPVHLGKSAVRHRASAAWQFGVLSGKCPIRFRRTATPPARRGTGLDRQSLRLLPRPARRRQPVSQLQWLASSQQEYGSPDRRPLPAGPNRRRP